MIFSVWYTSWVLSASTMLAYVIPYLALVVRSSYINHRVLFITKYQLLLGLAMFCWLTLVPGNTIQYSALLTLQVVAFMALTFHLSFRISEFRWEQSPKGVASVWFIANRYLRLINEKRADFEYAVRSRIPIDKSNGMIQLQTRIVLTYKAIISACLDIVILVRQLETIINARGGLPHPKSWQKVRETHGSMISAAIADLLLILLLCVVMFFASEKTIPDVFIKLGKSLQTFTAHQ